MPARGSRSALGDVPLALTAAQEAVDLIDDGLPSHHLSHAVVALAEAELEIGKPERTVDLLERSAARGDAARRPELPRLLPRAARARPPRARPSRGGRACRRGGARERRCGRLPLATAWLTGGRRRRARRQAGAARRSSRCARRDAERPARRSRRRSPARWPARARSCLSTASRRARCSNAPPASCRGSRHPPPRRRRARAAHYRPPDPPPIAARGGGNGVAALTKRELEIARRIVDRQTNRQIAEELFL